MQNNYKGYSLFNDVEDAALRTWNRCVVMCNINSDSGEEFAKNYANHLNKVEQMQMMAMLQYIKVKGAEAVRLEINQGKHATLDDDAKVVH